MTQTSYVAVAGATGTQGAAVVDALLAHGLPVRALTRTPGSAAARALAAAGAHVVPADFDDRESLDAALAGTAALFAVSTPFGPSGADLTTEVRQGTALIEAAADARVGHIVLTSAAHADRDTGIPHFDSKYRIERRLAGLGVPWTVLGPAAFMENYAGEWTLDGLRRGSFVLPMPPERPLALVPARDIGAFAALAITRPDEFAGRRIDIASDALTCPEIAEVLTSATGRPIGFQRLPISEIEAYSADLAAMFRYFTETGLDIDTAALRRDHPEVGWQDFADWAHGRAWPL
ncbi:NmrA/HSCARG family protein [Kitasatospora sp. NPDC085879]|uniref:NmrA/HSCARG family protein n=1 Tax=Kitasatospora sp. NPDC085879 TaxID=3154769 RepID=UPI003415493A